MINLTISEAIVVIRDRIFTETPFVLTRFGEGETAFLQKKPVHPQTIPNTINIQKLNDHPNGKKVIRDTIINNIKGSDMVGIGLTDEDKALGYRNAARWEVSDRELVLCRIDTSRIYRCTHSITRVKELGMIDNMRELLQGTPVHIITAHVKELQRNHIDEKLNAPVTYTQFPGWPTLKEQKEFLNAFSGREKVVLIGGGHAGRTLGVDLKFQRGKVCIDMGATLMAWAGIRDRVIFKPGAVYEHCVIENG